MDVAQALANVFSMKGLQGTYNLPGPSTLTYEYLLTLVSTITYNPASRAPTVPKAAALALAFCRRRARGQSALVECLWQKVLEFVRGLGAAAARFDDLVDDAARVLPA